MSINEEELQKLRHMLGIKKTTPKNRWGFRNYFAAGADDIPSMRKLESAGYVFDDGIIGHYRVYRATLLGCETAGLPEDKIAKLQKKNRF